MRAVITAVPIVLFVLATGCQKSPNADAAAPTVAADAPAASDGPLRWNNDVVWQGSLSRCRTSNAPPDVTCLREAMSAAGARAPAISAAETLSSTGELAFVSAWHEHDGIGVATVTYPFRANTNEGTRLVDSAGRLVDVDTDPLHVDDDPAVQAIKQAHSSAMAFPPAQQVGSSPVEGGGLRLLYRTPLRQCHACADTGHVDVAYDFDAQRSFVGQQVVPPAP